MKLLHYRIPSIVHYQTAARLQDELVAALLAYKSRKDVSHRRNNPTSNLTDNSTDSTIPKPLPAVITAQFHPVYTTGRRDYDRISPDQRKHLLTSGRASVISTLRGGQLTFHGPGQLVAYPILDLADFKLTARAYVSVLERALMATCAAYGVRTMTTENPGVWATPDRKIAALGVHLRRRVTSHGVGLNGRTDLWWFDRIVACGLEGKGATSLEREMGGEMDGEKSLDVEVLGRVFVGELARELGMGEGEVEVVDYTGG